VELWLEDYRKATGTDKAVMSIGIMEHVGSRSPYMDVLLSPRSSGY